jgi:hypothetical protein
VWSTGCSQQFPTCLTWILTPEELSVVANKLHLVASIQLELSRNAAPDGEILAAKAKETIARAQILAKSLIDDESFRISVNCDDLLVI